MNKILVDTNVFIYAIDENSRFHKQSQSIIYDNELDLFTTSKNLSEFLSVVTRSSHDILSIDDALMVIEDISEIVTILYPSAKSFSMLSRLVRKYKPTRLHIHDFEIISIALTHQISSIATFNIKDFHKVEEIKIETA